MGCYDAPSPPRSPDYAGAAAAQGAANEAAARVQGKINNPNVSNPYGTQTVSWANDQPTVTQTLDPAEQGLLNLGRQTQQELSGLALQGTGALKDVVGTGVNFSGLPPSPGGAGATREKVYQAMMGRVNEDIDRTKDQANSDLIAAGLRPGSKAYDDRMALIERGRTDAQMQAQLAAGQEASRDFGIDTQARKDAMAEYLTQRQVPLNEIAALMSGSQVQNPFAIPGYAQNAQVQPAPMFAATQASGNWGSDLYNAQAGMYGNRMSGLFGLGSAAMPLIGRGIRSFS